MIARQTIRNRVALPSVVQAPESCSRRVAFCAAPASGPRWSITRARYALAALAGSMFMANRRGAPGTGVA
ncbi:MAG: hypothetical protein U1E06_23680 [Tabrizicola sp.]|nr:hypothetical protein [Tabrizicola sp.]MDP3647298.1 hypothetical protein [Paracoccaceae bacterium]MDZ4069802.1 hypothetical protein [Tabrizicola sp.]